MKDFETKLKEMSSDEIKKLIWTMKHCEDSEEWVANEIFDFASSIDADDDVKEKLTWFFGGAHHADDVNSGLAPVEIYEHFIDYTERFLESFFSD